MAFTHNVERFGLPPAGKEAKEVTPKWRTRDNAPLGHTPERKPEYAPESAKGNLATGENAVLPLRDPLSEQEAAMRVSARGQLAAGTDQ